jgi:methionyl-tRNA synthetase
MAEKYGADATRYLLLAIGSFGEDTDITWEKLDEKYNADLANGIGNLTSRIVTLYNKAEFRFDLEKGTRRPFQEKSNIKDVLESGKLELELESVMEDVRILDRKIESEKPWELVKSDPEAFRSSIEELVRGVYYIALRLEPFMPEASNKIKESLLNKEKTSLFPRLKLS